SAGASLLNSQCTVTGLVPNEARKHKTFLCSNSNDRVRRSLLRGTVTGLVSNEAHKRKIFLCSNPNDCVRLDLLSGTRFVISTLEICRHSQLGNQLRIKVEHLARRQRGPNRDELRR